MVNLNLIQLDTRNGHQSRDYLLSTMFKFHQEILIISAATLFKTWRSNAGIHRILYIYIYSVTFLYGQNSITRLCLCLIVHLTALFRTTTSKLAPWVENWGCVESVIRWHYRKKVFGFVPFYPLNIARQKKGINTLETAAKGVSEGQSSDIPQLESTHQSNFIIISSPWQAFLCRSIERARNGTELSRGTVHVKVDGSSEAIVDMSLMRVHGTRSLRHFIRNWDGFPVYLSWAGTDIELYR